MPRGERKDPVWTKLPVPGVVTARRDSTQTLKLRQKRQEEEEQLKKQQRQAEEAARILARRWRQEDRGEGSGGREKEEEALGGPRQFREILEGRETVRTERADPPGVWVVTEERKPRPPSARSEKREVESTERRPSADVAAAFEGPGRPEKRRREHRSPSHERREWSAAPPTSQQQPPPSRREAAVVPATASQRHQAPHPAASSSRGSGARESTSRRSPSPQAPERREAPPAQKVKAKGNSKLAGVFGLDDSDEERKNTARQMEMAAAGRRQSFARRAGIGSTGSTGSASLPSRGEAPKMLDPAEVYMRCSQWKQSCNGKEMPMPEDLRQALAQVTGNALGHSAPKKF